MQVQSLLLEAQHNIKVGQHTEEWFLKMEAREKDIQRVVGIAYSPREEEHNKEVFKSFIYRQFFRSLFIFCQLFSFFSTPDLP